MKNERMKNEKIKHRTNVRIVVGVFNMDQDWTKLTE